MRIFDADVQPQINVKDWCENIGEIPAEEKPTKRWFSGLIWEGLKAFVSTKILGKEYYPKYHPKQPLTGEQLRRNLKILACESFKKNGKLGTVNIDVGIIEKMIADWEERNTQLYTHGSLFVCCDQEKSK